MNSILTYKKFSRQIWNPLQEIMEQDIERIKNNEGIKEEIKEKIELIMETIRPLEKYLFDKFE